MKILVIGNGFDLEHNLPTSYQDFLNFCNSVLELESLGDCSYYKKLKPTQKEYIEALKSDKPLYSRFVTLLKDNNLLGYFNIQAERENWIDLERCIKEIVTEFSHIEQEMISASQNVYVAGPQHRIHQLMTDLGLSNMNSRSLGLSALRAIHQTLCVCLDRFSIALELYVCKFVNTTPIDGIAPDIIAFDANNILTFNYSNTYERVYGGVHWNESVSYIHGLACDNDSEISNIILGITSSQIQTEKEVHYVEFEKYFQRITKKTGNKYKEWLQSEESDRDKIKIVFFGHSLDATDSDIIKDLILCEKAEITIYYHNEEAYQRIVSNLNNIIGKDELIKAVAEPNPKIVFKEQSKHQQITTGGVEITRDIQTIYRFHLCSNDKINSLLNKIERKIREKDLHYFYSQRKAISLFDALNYHQIDSFDMRNYFEVCKELSYETRNGNLVYYRHEEWDDYSLLGVEHCAVETARLISAINKSNEKVYHHKIQNNPFGALGELETVKEIKDKLLEIFGESNPDKSYWSNLGNIFSSIEDLSILSKALQELKTDIGKLPIPIRVKIKHMDAMYSEHCYEMHMLEAYQENNNFLEE